RRAAAQGHYGGRFPQGLRPQRVFPDHAAGGFRRLAALGTRVSESVIVTVAERVATITFNRPRVMNALDTETIEAFAAACEAATTHPEAGVVVLRGAGPAFVAGGDVASFKANLAGLPDEVPRLAGALHAGIKALRGARQPVIASVHGAVAGAGISI